MDEKEKMKKKSGKGHNSALSDILNGLFQIFFIFSFSSIILLKKMNLYPLYCKDYPIKHSVHSLLIA